MAGAFLARLLFSLLIAAAWAAPVGAGLQDYPFRVESEEKDGGQELVAQNEGPAPITVRVVLTERENVASDRQWPVTAVVPPNQSLVLARLFRASPLVSFKYRHQFGDIAAVPDATATYRLPFDDGHSFLISQAYGGVMTTHTGPENAHAVDIVM